MSQLIAALLAFGLTGSQVDGTRRISLEERRALIVLYEATRGPEWRRRDGWLGPAGTECAWRGVGCGIVLTGESAGHLAVRDLDLSHNNLSGKLPAQLSSLKSLQRLQLVGNLVEGPIPNDLLKQWDNGAVDIQPESLAHSVTTIEVRKRFPSLDCSGDETVLSVDGVVRSSKRACDSEGKVYCTVRTGITRDFDRIARFIQRGEQSAEREERPIDSTWSDLPSQTITISSTGGSHAMELRAGAVSLSTWANYVLIEGVLARTEWRNERRSMGCTQ